VRWYEADSVAVDEERAGRWVRALGPFLTLGALVLVAVHLIWPHVRIDSITLVLLAVAVLPWLGPLFKSVELPGGWKFEFQEFKRQVAEELEDKEQKVQTLADRVERVESAVFVGVRPALEAKLREALEEFHAFLGQIGLAAGEPPTVRTSAELRRNAHYLPATNEIVLSEDFAEDADVLLDLYARHVLAAVAPGAGTAPADDPLAIGLADYLTCSFNGSPLLAPGAAAALGEGAGPGALRNLANDRSFATLDERADLFERAEVWGGAFWELRTLLGGDVDELLATAWKAEPASESEPVRFVRRVAGLAGDRSGDVLAVFERRGLEPGS
jgi:hypothetical protein